MCRPQDLTTEMASQNFGVFKHVKIEDCVPVLPEKRPHCHEEETSEDSEMSDTEKQGAHSEQGTDGAHKAKKRKIWRVMLSPNQALEIYNRRPPLKQLHGKCGYAHGSMRNARIVAQDYNVSAKTIRDIWNRYSWAKVTRQLWTEQEAKHYADTYTVRGHQGVAGLTGRRNSAEGHADLSLSRTASAESIKEEVDRLLSAAPHLHQAAAAASNEAASPPKLPRIQTIEGLLNPLAPLSAAPSAAAALSLPLPLPASLQPASSLLQTLLRSAKPAPSPALSLDTAVPGLPLSLPLPTAAPTLQAQIDESTRRLQQLISLNQRCLDQQRLQTVSLIPPLPLPRV